MKTSTSIQSNNRTIELSSNFHRGSALLVVLGMLAFMVISAVAFSAYMRYARLPSSFLRQTTSARQLAKAAMAEAIDEIDAAIGNMPHPGIWNVMPKNRSAQTLDNEANEYYFPRNNGEKLNRNLWLDHVYIGNRGKGDGTVEDNLVAPFIDDEDEEADPDAGTVSTLSLEALAYIPAPLVNSARYYSRRSNAAKWHTMAFDAGRFAFCAIDVSDYFDVNALSADVGRSSSAAGRVSLAYLFEEQETTIGDGNGHTSYRTRPSDWETFMNKFRSESSAAAAASGNDKPEDKNKVPLISVADLNLALHNEGSLKAFSPFGNYVDPGTAASFYDGADVGMIRMLTFVTDSWMPVQNLDSTSEGGRKFAVLDLADEKNRLFDESYMDKNQTGVRVGDVMSLSTPGLEKLCPKAPKAGEERGLNEIDKVMLFDYLDENSTPLSLAIPQVERSPMVVGVQPKFGDGTIKVTMKEEPEGVSANLTSDSCPGVVAGNETMRTVRWTCTYKLDAAEFAKIVANMEVKALTTYPFRRGSDLRDTRNYEIDGLVEFFFTNGKFNFRTETQGGGGPEANTSELLHVKKDGNGLAPANDSPCVIGVKLEATDCSPWTRQGTKGLPKTEEETLRSVTLTPEGGPGAAGAVSSKIEANPLLVVTWEVKQQSQINETTGARTWSNVDPPTRTAAVSSMRPLNMNAEMHADFESGTMLTWLNANEGHDVMLRAAVWLRVKDKADATLTYDLVPACMLDDSAFLKGSPNNAQSMGPDGGSELGQAYPIMSFAGGSAFRFGDQCEGGFDSASTPVPVVFAPKGLACPDPRWNWAPEHWYQLDNVADGDGAAWLADVRSKYLGQEGRDNDIFLATSDAGYLQSVYELAFLPRLCDLKVSKGGDRLGLMQTLDNREAVWQTEPYANKALMWRTYNPYGRVNKNDSPVVRDPFDNLGFVNEGGGFRVNPYSDDTNVVMAVFANTPCDWWAAAAETSDDSVGVPSSERVNNAEQFNKKYAFSQMNDKAKFAWKDLWRVANNFIASVRQEYAGDGNRTSDHNDDINGCNFSEDLREPWQKAFDWLDWSGTFFDMNNPKLHFGLPRKQNDFYDESDLTGNTDAIFDVDRKFLYGYWRECFAAKQQLFLVFVRAEPTMMGGGAVGTTPPSLGARAVALVWRDPTRTAQDCGGGSGPRPHRTSPRPHRTRVLFYRQFE